MKKILIALSVVTFTTGAAGTAQADGFECRNMFESQHADIDGPVLSVKDLGRPVGKEARYYIIVRDHFTGCRISSTTDTVCKVGQHASIVGGSLGLWMGDEKDSDSDYPYLGTHIWTCE